ncbi:LysR family transcriptional regulator [Gordonibacter massiliensis (ex Traore et al. 2017)]|uniref:LysR family transcriptional regulator n=1 Tax=Gordonibacter massiliensis (ex Traore et al. 2017) TaxID=1841863 RepID=A0A842JIC3_9ACTN|nr:LysR family transcriptional regulator [Gordonibacter massiliensis (ex Traore et al. 2017)]MBC2888830.1 LysR family transcriptional regulator [Gordonibacter massiliensis (ex Traore et al. 2017)]
MNEDARLVLAIYEHGTISEASRHMHLSQPALSKKLKALENRLGTKLFDRARHPLEPTLAGQAYLAFAKRAVAAENRVIKEVDAIARNARRRLTVGVSPARCDTLLADVVERFCRTTDDCTLSLVGIDSDEHLDALLSDDRIDFAAMTPSVPNRQLFVVETICEEHLQLFAPVAMADDLRGGKEAGSALDPAALEQVPFIMPPKPWPLNWIIRTSMDALGVRLNVAMHSCSTEMTFEMVRRGLGASILPSTFDFGRMDDEVARFDIAGLEKGGGLVLAHRKDWRPSEDACSFISILRAWLREHPGTTPTV